MVYIFGLVLFSSLSSLIIVYDDNYYGAFGQLAVKADTASNIIINNSANANSSSAALTSNQDSIRGQQSTPLGFVTKGTINSVTIVPTSKWIVTGDWRMIVNSGNVTFFETHMTWRNSNGTTSHTHELLNFGQDGQVVSLQQEPNEDVIISGVTDVGMNNRIWVNEVPTTININRHEVIVITVDGNKTNHHFVGQPVLGIVSSFLPCSDLPGSNKEVLAPCSVDTFQDTNLGSSNATLATIAPNESTHSQNTTSSSKEATSSQSFVPYEGTTAPADSVISENNVSSQSTPTITNTSISSAQSQDQEQSEPKQSSFSTSEVASTDSSDNLSFKSDVTHAPFSTYENASAGIKINYPSEWRLQQGRILDPTLHIAAKFFPRADSNSPFTIAIRNLTGNVTNDGYAKDTVDSYKTGLDEFEQSQLRTNGTLSGYQAYEIAGTFIDEVSVKNQLREVGTLLNNTAYILQFSSPEYKFPDYLPALEEMIDSFQIIPITQVSDKVAGNNKTSPSQLAVSDVTIPSKDNDTATNQSQTAKDQPTPPLTSATPETDDQEPTLEISIATGSDPSYRGQDQIIYVDVVDSSSNIRIAEAEVDGLIVDGEDARALIAGSNDTEALIDIDIDEIDGEGFSGETDDNGQLIVSAEIPESFEEGEIAIVLTADADGYDPVTKIAAFTLQSDVTEGTSSAGQ